jgi:hypothetical protein
MRDTRSGMAAHLAPSTRRRSAGILALAAVVGAGAFALAGLRDRPDRGEAPPTTTGASVLGVVVTPDDALPRALPAAPATFDVPAGGAASTTTRPTTAPAPSTTAPSATLVPPTGIENTTTTTQTPTTIDLSTTSTTEPTSTTQPPAP